jgi:subtilisin family serine protease
MSVRVFRKAGSTSAATTAQVLKGITWSVDNGARVLNMSFAGPRDPLLERHVKAAADRGLINVAAAGNNGSNAPPAFPAAYDDVIAVTAIDANDRLYEKANRGGYVALAAPGVDVIVPAIGRSHHFQSGTSFAAAHVSGVIALLIEVNPNITTARLREVLAQSSDDLGVPGRDPEFGAGRLNVAKAMEMAAQ